MKVGAVLPQFESRSSPDRYRTFAQTVEELGFHHLLAYDHVVGPAPDRPGWEGVYTHEIPLHEPVSLLSYLAGVTEQIRLVTGILILPQRQTALVAKQAAEIDVLSGGRLRLGVGIGWNEPEYVALDQDFTTRGRRVEEQLTVLRKLWTEALVDFEGEFHDIPRVGINPRPVQQPIPIWMGGGADPVIDRIARMADGWVLPGGEPGELAPRIDRLRATLHETERTIDDLALLARIGVSDGTAEAWVERVHAWRDVGATHLAVHARQADNPTDRLATFISALDGSDIPLTG